MERLGRELGRQLSRLLMPIWAIGLLVVTSSLMVGHWVTLPHPEEGETFPVKRLTGLSGVRGVTACGEKSIDLPRAFHFLYGDCPCSRRVLQSVVQRQPVDGIIERIVFVGEDSEMESAATSNGFEVDTVSPEELLSVYRVEAAPLLVVTDPQGRIIYLGGYTSRKQGPDNRDREILESIAKGKTVESMPLYGCAISKNLRDIIDPLRLK